MSELNKPLSPKGSQKGGNIPLLGIGLVCGAVALVGYLVWDRQTQDGVVVSLNDAKTISENANTEKKAAAQPSNGEAVTKNTDGEVEPEAQPAEPKKPVVPNFKPKKQVVKKRPAGRPVSELVEKSEFGPLPKVGRSGMRPLDIYSQSANRASGVRVAIIVGGLGISQTGTKQAIAKLPSSVTLAYSPVGNSLNRWMQVARKEGHEVVLQIPMEPFGYPTVNPGRGTLTTKASEGQNLKNLRWSLGRMTNYPVVMNYLGANFTPHSKAMRPVLEEIKARGLGWLDDGSSHQSLSLDLAKQLRLPNASSNMVLDAQQQPKRIASQLQALELIAKKRGFAIATASAFPESIKQITTWVAAANKRGIQVVPLSNLIRDYK